MIVINGIIIKILKIDNFYVKITEITTNYLFYYLTAAMADPQLQ